MCRVEQAIVKFSAVPWRHEMIELVFMTLPTLQFPRADWRFQNLMAFVRDPLMALDALAARPEPLVPFRLGTRKLILVREPEHIKEVLVTRGRSFIKSLGTRRTKRILGEGLVTSEGEFHRRQRRLAQPAFHRDRIKAYGETMVASALRTRETWVAGQTIDMSEAMSALTLAIVGKTLFDSDVEGDATDIRAAMQVTLGLFDSLLKPSSDILYHLPLPSTLRFKKARGRIDQTIFRMISERRGRAEDRGDLLSMLMAAQDSEGDGGRMTDLQVRDEAMTLFLAGHETTATALSWAWYLLANHPEVERLLHQEVDTALGGRLPNAEDLAALPYTRNVMTETMRCYPPAWIFGREAIEDVEVGGYLINKGTTALVSQWVVHRDPRFYTDPHNFEPGRWSADLKAKNPLFAYFPFGGGTRICIGESFAWMEGILLLAVIAQRWRPRMVSTEAAKPQPLVTLRPKGGLRMVLEARSSVLAEQIPVSS